jgi:hypothetical protein
MPISGVFDKQKNSLAKRVLDFYEDARYNYLSAREDSKTYGKNWKKSVKKIRDDFDGLNEFSTEMKKYLDEKTVFDDNVSDASSVQARELFKQIKDLRFNSEELNDPFAKQMGEDVIDTLLAEAHVYAKFCHYALRAHSGAIPDEAWQQHKLPPDTITPSVMGLDLAVSDIPLYIIEHYGDDKDTKRIRPKFKAALELLKKVYMTNNSEENWNKLIQLEIKKNDENEEKAEIDFIVPNKPMYRIFEINDIKELKGFSGDWLVQEKYDGIRIQIHKMDEKVKIFTYNKKDITSQCKNIVDKLKAKHFGDVILDAELILYDNDEPLHRADTIAHLFKGKYKGAELKARVFDIMHHEDKDISDYPLKERINIMFYQFSQHSSDDLGFPNKKNSKIADSIKEVEKYSEAIMQSRTSEGVVIKDMESTYYIGSKKNPKWIKWKKFVDLDVIVLDKKKTKSNLYSYSVGVGPLTGEETREHNVKEIDGKSYLPVGKALNTKQSVEVGSIIRVKVDEVKRKGKGYSLFSAKVIEIPEVETPEKLITLELLAKDSKKSLAYDVQDALLKYTITDGIHGKADIILKGDYEGFTIYGFNGDSLMEKNALTDIDDWKDQLMEINKTKSSEARGIIKNFLIEKDPNKDGVEIEEIFKFIKKQRPEETNILWTNQINKLKNWMNDYDEFIPIGANKFTYNDSHITKKAPKEEHGKFALYMRKDKNINLVIDYEDKTLAWIINVEDTEDIFNLFGKAGKFPAEIANNIDREELLDKGKIELGVQRHGYHEYRIDGNRFDTRLHFRVVPVNKKDTWIVWTGYKQEMLDKKENEDLWDITQDRFKKLTMQIE